MTRKSGFFSFCITCRLRSTTRFVARGGGLLLLLCAASFLPAQDQPEILATLNGFPAGWRILAINPDTGETRDVTNLPTADN